MSVHFSGALSLILLSLAMAPLSQAQELATDSELIALMPEVQTDLLRMTDEFRSLQTTTPELVQDMNARMFKALDDYKPEAISDRRQEIPMAEAHEIYREMRVHPVVGLQAVRSYDPQDSIGFCFGKATWAYIELLRRGVDKRAIKKIFVVGPIGTRWQFHVATMVRTNEGWVVLDRDLRRLMNPRDWAATFGTNTKKRKLMVYVTEPSRLGGSTTAKFSAESFMGDHFTPNYSKFFENMMTSFRTLSKIQAEARSCQNVFSPQAGRGLRDWLRDIKSLPIGL